VGLKEALACRTIAMGVSSNRTIVGLKVLRVLWWMMGFLQSSNRTIVGLKEPTLLAPSPCYSGSNRTIVGLKVLTPKPSCLTDQQQSQHLGLKDLLANSADTSTHAAAIAPLWD
jgi:hypothetical protein